MESCRRLLTTGDMVFHEQDCGLCNSTRGACHCGTSRQFSCWGHTATRVRTERGAVTPQVEAPLPSTTTHTHISISHQTLVAVLSCPMSVPTSKQQTPPPTGVGGAGPGDNNTNDGQTAGTATNQSNTAAHPSAPDVFRGRDGAWHHKVWRPVSWEHADRRGGRFT